MAKHDFPLVPLLAIFRVSWGVGVLLVDGRIDEDIFAGGQEAGPPQESIARHAHDPGAMRRATSKTTRPGAAGARSGLAKDAKKPAAGGLGVGLSLNMR